MSGSVWTCRSEFACRALALVVSSGSLVRPDAALSPRRATHFLLLRQEKVSKEKATLVPASLRFAAGNLWCSVQPGSCINSPAAQTSTIPVPPGPPLLGASTRVLGKRSGTDSGTDSGRSGLCVATIFIAAYARFAWAGSVNHLTIGSAAGFWGSDRDFAAQHPQGVPKAWRIRALTPKTPESASESASAPASASIPQRRVAGLSSTGWGG